MSNKIIYIMGKSGSGKNTVYNELIKKLDSNRFKPIIMNTTRPIRKGEVNGVDYNFTTAKEYLDYKDTNRILEERMYETTKGKWVYFTLKDHIDLAHYNYIGIGTLQSYKSLVRYYPKENVIPIYIQVPDDGDRLLRSIIRERENERPNYSEVCRRFIADENDFSYAKLFYIDPYRVINRDVESCVTKILDLINQECGD